MSRVGWLAGLLAHAFLARCALAQDFTGTTPASFVSDPSALLDHALPSTTVMFAAAAAQTRWWGLPELETRAASVSGGWHAWRASMGLSQTGEPDLGWTTLGLAFGGASERAGAGFRACARRDRDAPWSVTRAFTTGAGAEAGAGAWLVPAPGLRVWASAPQVWLSGASPPLARPLELGARYGEQSALWVRLVSPRAGDDGERAVGLSLALPPLDTWAEVRDSPLRASVGLVASIASLRIGTRVDAHPVLGETVRVSLAWVRGGL